IPTKTWESAQHGQPRLKSGSRTSPSRVGILSTVAAPAARGLFGFWDTFRKADTMSTTMPEALKKRRQRRRFDDDFKAQAVRLVLDEGKRVGAVARDFELTETALRAWVHRPRANRTGGRTGLTTAEREELAQLRKENRQLRLEREILKNAAAFFAKEPAIRSR